MWNVSTKVYSQLKCLRVPQAEERFYELYLRLTPASLSMVGSINWRIVTTS
jgi:hypothetical protein